MATEAGLEVVAPFHDALLLHVPLTEVDESIEFVAGYPHTHEGYCHATVAMFIFRGTPETLVCRV